VQRAFIALSGSGNTSWPAAFWPPSLRVSDRRAEASVVKFLELVLGCWDCELSRRANDGACVVSWILSRALRTVVKQ